MSQKAFLKDATLVVDQWHRGGKFDWRLVIVCGVVRIEERYHGSDVWHVANMADPIVYTAAVNRMAWRQVRLSKARAGDCHEEWAVEMRDRANEIEKALEVSV